MDPYNKEPPGYPPPYPPGGGMPMVGFQPPPQPPPGYAYPPVPVPITNDGTVTQQPGYGPGPGQQYYPGPPQQMPYYPPPNQSYGQAYQVPMQPMMTQPVAGYGQTIPLNVPNGLEVLTRLDRLYIKQKVELMEAIFGCETKNRYKVKDAQGNHIFSAKESTDCCTRNCCGRHRPFDIKIKDHSDQEVIHLSSPLGCDSCCFPCCLKSIEVYTGNGELCGKVEQEWSLCTPKFSIRDASGNPVLRIEGPFCTFSLCGSVDFQVLSVDGSTEVGKISKQWSGLLREAFTDADNFGISFPIDLDVKMKAVMLGASFLIDFMFFEKTGNEEEDVPGML